MLRGASERIKSIPEELGDFWVQQSLYCLKLSTLVSKQQMLNILEKEKMKEVHLVKQQYIKAYSKYGYTLSKT